MYLIKQLLLGIYEQHFERLTTVISIPKSIGHDGEEYGIEDDPPYCCHPLKLDRFK